MCSSDLFHSHDMNKINWDEIQKLPCWAGLDLAQTKDFSALTLLFHDDKTKQFYLKSYKWAASENIDDMALKFEPNLKIWANEGYIDLTDGNVMDADKIEKDIIQIIKALPNFQSLAYDRMFAHQLITHIEAEGIKCHHYSQNVTNMAAPTAGIEADIRNRKITHEPDPVS